MARFVALLALLLVGTGAAHRAPATHKDVSLVQKAARHLRTVRMHDIDDETDPDMEADVQDLEESQGDDSNVALSAEQEGAHFADALESTEDSEAEAGSDESDDEAATEDEATEDEATEDDSEDVTGADESLLSKKSKVTKKAAPAAVEADASQEEVEADEPAKIGRASCRERV